MRRRRRVWNDRGLESTRVGWVFTGAAFSIAVSAVVLLVVDVAAGAAWWAYVLLLLWPPMVWWVGLMGRRERARALAHRNSMRAYGESITASFDALLEERSQDQ
jgi:hypothetical protein